MCVNWALLRRRRLEASTIRHCVRYCIGEGGKRHFLRMDAEALELPDGGFDVVLCALGLM